MHRGVPIVSALTAGLLLVGPWARWSTGAQLTPPPKGCAISASGVSFGTYSPDSGLPLDTIGQLTYQCYKEARPNVRIDINQGLSSTFDRMMASGANRLRYNLFQDSQHTVIWGDGTGGTQYYFIGDPVDKKDIIVSIYGRIPGGQNVQSGTYTDSLTATIFW
jgi:spore coat protein U-like protein